MLVGTTLAYQAAKPKGHVHRIKSLQTPDFSICFRSFVETHNAQFTPYFLARFLFAYPTPLGSY